MPRKPTKPLADSDASIADILASGDRGKFSEGSIKGLFLYIDDGAPKWRLKRPLHGKEVLFSVGIYPDTSIDEARRQAQQAVDDIANGIHPKAARDSRKIVQQELAGLTFTKVAERWLERRTNLKPKTLSGHRGILKNHLIPVIGRLHPKDITIEHLVTILEVRLKDSPVMQRATLRLLIRILNAAVSRGLVAQNIALGRQELLDDIPKSKHHPALVKEDDLVEYIRRLDALGNSGSDCVIAALWLQLLIPARPSELCAMRWSQLSVNWEQAPNQGTWTYIVPKTGQEHTVPLPGQAIAQLSGIREYSLALNRRAVASASPFGRFADDETANAPDWVFPSTGTFGQHIASETLLRRLRSDLDYPVGTITGHGFRATFHSLSQEVLGTEYIVCEMCLGHRMPGALADTYSRTRLPLQQREAMVKWADYIEGLYHLAVSGVKKTDAARTLTDLPGDKLDISGMSELEYAAMVSKSGLKIESE
ncbi:Prophage CP4-57 integrase [compost metagenome]